MQFIYPKEKGPVWIDWKGAAEGGLRFVACTDDEGEPRFAAVEIDARGEMKTQPDYQPLRGWYTTQLFTMPDGNRQLWRFVALVSPDGLQIKAKPVPSTSYAIRLLPWGADVPAAAF